MSRQPIAKTVEEEIRRAPAFEEDADIGEQDADSLRWHAKGLRARARYWEDKGEQMAPVSLRWLRVISKALDTGADSLEADRG